MARSSTTDTLEKFRFLVEFSTSANGGNTTDLGKAGFFECGMPKRTTSKIEYREGNDPDIFSLSAGLSKMEDVTLTRGVIARAPNSATVTGKASAMYAWMSAVHVPEAGGMAGYGAATGGKRTGDKEVAGKAATATEIEVIGTAAGLGNPSAYRKDVTIKVLDRSGQVARQFKLAQAFVVSFTPGSDLNAGEDGDKLLESVTLAYEDFVEEAV